MEQRLTHQALMDRLFMKMAIAEAEKAAAFNEVPVGAVLVRDNILFAAAFNTKETAGNPLCHAELLLIAKGAKKLGGWRLTGTTLYVTLEPCPMCAGAMVQARISRCVFGASDPKSGAAGSVCNILDQPFLNHRVDIAGGVLAEECGDLLRRFFIERRNTEHSAKGRRR